MSPTSYQAAPPRFMTIADPRGCVKLPDFRSNAIAFIRSNGQTVCKLQGHRADAESVNANRPYNAGGCLLWPSIDASGGSPTLRNLVGRPLTRAKRFLSFRSTPREGFTMICAWKSAVY